jgi:hypothetical protein
MKAGPAASEPCADWEVENVTIEDDESWDTTWHDGSRKVSRASWPTGLRRIYGTWYGLATPDSGIGWSGRWIVDVHEYELARGEHRREEGA